MPTPLSLTAKTLYAELLEYALAVGVTENISEVPGSVVRKVLRGSTYLYYQYRDLSGRTRQAYLGPDNEDTRRAITAAQERSSRLSEDIARLNELRAAFIAAGGYALDHAPMRVIKAFADAGALQAGPGKAVLIGTHAFSALGNVLGVRWDGHERTQDIDIAADQDVDIVVDLPDLAAPDVLTQLNMGFLPIQSLNLSSPSTSFKIRGQELRVDLLTPERGAPSGKPKYVRSLSAYAEPLRFLDYLIEDPVPAVITGRRDIALVNIPKPERFALHKLLISENRSSIFANKAEKDRRQGAQILRALINESPEGIMSAKADLDARGKVWSSRLLKALKKVRAFDPETAEYVLSLDKTPQHEDASQRHTRGPSPRKPGI